MIHILATLLTVRFMTIFSRLPYALSGLRLPLSAAVVALLFGCQPQPQSMFEQQAEADTAESGDTTYTETQTDSNATAVVKPVQAVDTSVPTMDVIRRQAIARQRGCDPKSSECQSFELNVLQFQPEQPWLTSIMWQSIARLLNPQMPLTSQDETAKKTVSILFNQIAYSEQRVTTLPLHQRIDTDLVLSAQEDSQTDMASPKNSDATQTGYLVVRLTDMSTDAERQFAHYVMLDMQTQLQLTLSDILLPHITHQQLLATFQNAKKEWLSTQGIAPDKQDDWPLALSKQWYLDTKGLHMVYQSEELLAGNTQAVDLMVPYNLLDGLINPRYIVGAGMKSDKDKTATETEVEEETEVPTTASVSPAT